ncbi:polypeptide N-acetylgalactosaminyltransferase 16-like isoform X2 [Stegodyphus dumicola]|uniref:polypeptide N-acetylgalactosaminyltransferase 16-like isoform X2 n=1 Tax=Stegodyphus dumicola TaxID=202533 RepID=UPI0015B35FF3|nr:polypeptide N-acetylgalactosaminyltransferase 16-like isoform X2 [Stegodyphus dumicola]
MWRVRKRRFLCLGIVCLCCVYVIRIEVNKSWANRGHKFLPVNLQMKPITLAFDHESYIAKEKHTQKDGFAKHAFNFYASNSVAPDRNIPDSRHPNCKNKIYNIPQSFSVSVIITFHNEARSALLRTIISVLNRSPDDLLKDIILVDDFSDDASDGSELSNFPKVTLYRNSQREGLIRSRMIGAQISTGSHVMFLDSHCEVNIGWLTPLLQTVAKHPKALVTPVADIIDTDNFEYKPTSGEIKGGFDWSLNFRWQLISKTDNEEASDPTKIFISPVIPGGLFLIRRTWFYELGGLDKGMAIWGAENIEMSIKAWLCGGEVLTVPCSRVGHIFRKRHPYSFPPNGSLSTYLRNSRRIAEAWLDEYKYQFYEIKPQAKNQDFGSIEELVKVKRTLNCKPFQWFLDNVYPELKPLSKDALALGQLQQENMCLQSEINNKTKSTVNLAICLEKKPEQEWYFAKSGDLHQGKYCLTARINLKRPKIYLTKCTNSTKQKWTRRRRLLMYQGLCLENAMDPVIGLSHLTLNPCRQNAFSQRWDFSVELQTWGDR